MLAPVLSGAKRPIYGGGDGDKLYWRLTRYQITDAENDQVSSDGERRLMGHLTAGTQTGSTITFTDTASNVTADLAALKYTPTTSYHGTDSISVNVVPRRSVRSSDSGVRTLE